MVDTVNARVWKPVYEAYRDALKDKEIVLSDMISEILLYVAIYNPKLLEEILVENHSKDKNEAMEIIMVLQEKIKANLRYLVEDATKKENKVD